MSGPSTGSKVAWPAVRTVAKPYSVGRIPENDLVVNDPEVSGRHATMAWNRQVGRRLRVAAVLFIGGPAVISEDG